MREEGEWSLYFPPILIAVLTDRIAIAAAKRSYIHIQWGRMARRSGKQQKVEEGEPPQSVG